MAVTVLGLVLIVGGASFTFLVVATIVLGAGTGILGPSRVIVLANVFPDLKASAVSISQASGTLGNAVLPIIAGIVMGYLGWRGGLGLLLPFCVVVGIGLWRLVPDRPATTSTTSVTETGSRSARALSGKAAVLGTMMMLGVMITFQSLTGFLPTYLTDVTGLSPSEATVLFGVFFGAGLVMQLLAGVVADLLTPQRTVGIFAIITLPAVVLILGAETGWGLTAGVILASGLLGCFPPGLTYLVSVFPASVQGPGFGVIRTIYIGGGSLGPIGVGLVADWLTLWMAFFLLIVVLACLCFIAGVLPALKDNTSGGEVPPSDDPPSSD